VPDGADFIVEVRSTHRLFFYGDSEATRDRLMVDLEEFAPHFDETAEATQSLAATHPTLAPEKSGFRQLRARSCRKTAFSETWTGPSNRDAELAEIRP
jgi:hypothetical protein